MPKQEEAGFYDATVKTAGFNLEFKTFECMAEDDKGLHYYPSVYLENKAGGPNSDAFEKLESIFGWTNGDGEDLIARAVGKKIRIGVQDKTGDKKGCYYNFCKPSKPKKDAPPAKDVNSWLSGLRGVAGGGSADLSISESSVPFAPCK